jgi:hypothetical protein
MPVNNYSLNVQEISLENDATYNYSNGDVERAYGVGLSTSVAGVNLLPAYDKNWLYNQALDKLNEKVRGRLNLTLDLAEAGKTARMLNAQNQILDYTRSFVGRFGPLKTASKAFLMYTYGIKPTVQSLFGVADENIRVVLNSSERFKARVFDRTYHPSQCGVNTVVGSVNFPLLTPSDSDIKLSCEIGVDVRTPEFDLARWSSLNPYSLFYELLPLSFVADWFYNVGGYLNNLETALWYNSRFRAGYVTFLSAGGVQLFLKSSGPISGGATSHTSVWQGKATFTDIGRQKLLAWPLPEPPRLRAVLGASRLTAGASLLAGFLSGGGHPKKISRGASEAVQRTVIGYQSGRPAKVFRFPPTNYHL